MKLSPMTVLIFSLAFAGSGDFFHLRAQDASAAPRTDTETERCVHWMKATVPGISMLDPADFCLGVKKDGVPDAWYSLWKCGQAAEQLTSTARRYCASSGQLTASEAWAAGFSSTTRDWREFLDGTSDGAKDSHRIAATFYSRTAQWMESLRVPAGMYKLIPSKSPDGWSLAVAKQDGEWSDAKPPQQYLGTVQMKASASDNPTGEHNLGISTRRWAEGCPGPSVDRNVRELHFMYGSTDLFVCIRPDQVPQNQEANIGER
jgi:hypothetical protein